MRKVSATRPSMANAIGSRAAVASTPRILDDAAMDQIARGGVCSSGTPLWAGPSHCPDSSVSRAAPANDVGANDHRIFLRLGHGGEAEPECRGEQGARDFDEPQVSDVMDDGGAIRIEEHHLHFGANPRRFFF